MQNYKSFSFVANYFSFILRFLSFPLQGLSDEEIGDLESIFGRRHPMDQLRSVFPSPTKRDMEEAFSSNKDDYTRMIVVKHPWVRCYKKKSV